VGRGVQELGYRGIERIRIQGFKHRAFEKEREIQKVANREAGYSMQDTWETGGGVGAQVSGEGVGISGDGKQ
jgi:hypothetical protein